MIAGDGAARQCAECSPLILFLILILLIFLKMPRSIEED